MLSGEEINYVREFVGRKGYSQIEVQSEMIDHIACIVEEKREENPNLSIEKAVANFHASFGIFGFSDWAERLEKQSSRKVRIQFLAILQSFLFGHNFLKMGAALLASIAICLLLSQFNFLESVQLLIYLPAVLALTVIYTKYYKITGEKPFQHSKSMTINHVNAFLIVIHIIAQSLSLAAKYAAEENLMYGYLMISAAYFLISLSIMVWFEGIAWAKKEAAKYQLEYN